MPTDTATTLSLTGVLGSTITEASQPQGHRARDRHQPNSGQITIRTPEGGSMKLVLPSLAVASIREGDDVAVDVLVNPARR